MVAVATCEAEPHPYTDPLYREDLLVDELRERGVRVEAVVWDKPGTDWTLYDLILPRATWDYIHTEKTGKFLEWLAHLDKVGAHILNNTDIIRWNIDKHYLLDLARKGVPVPDTVFVNREDSEHTSLLDIMDEQRWEEAFVKPCIAADSFGALKVSREEECEDGNGQKHIEDLLHHHNKDVMIQKFISDVQHKGEWSVIFFNNVFAYGVNKLPALDGANGFGSGFVIVDKCPVPTRVQTTAQNILDAIGGCLLYARVDLMEDGDDVVLGELELIEPSLYFGNVDQSAQKFADVICNELNEINK